MQRVFIGVPVDHTAQRQIGALLNPYRRSSRGISWVPGQNRHMTLAFLGDRHAWEIEKLARSMRDAYGDTASFRTGSSKLTRFPDSKGRIIALEFDADTPLMQLFQATQKLVRESGLDQERQRFRPHITLARIRNASGMDVAVSQVTDIRLKVDKITLFQSTLVQGRRAYQALEETELD